MLGQQQRSPTLRGSTQLGLNKPLLTQRQREDYLFGKKNNEQLSSLLGITMLV